MNECKGVISVNNEDKTVEKMPVEPVTIYHERKIGKTLYRITSVFKGEVELSRLLEDLAIRKILRGDDSIAGKEETSS